MYQTSTEYRDTTRTIVVPATLTVRDLAAAAARLRSWAARRGVPEAGAPVAQLIGKTVRVHLPIGAEVAFQPDAEVRPSALPSATVNRTHAVVFGDIPQMARRLLPGASLEFHSANGNFVWGDILVQRGDLMPASLAYAGASELEIPAGNAPPALAGAVSTRSRLA